MSEASPEPEGCPRYPECSAPVCPLDRDRLRRVHLPEDRACFFLLEAVKSGAQKRFPYSPEREIIEKCLAARDAIAERFSALRHKINRAATTGSRRGAGERLRRGLEVNLRQGA